MLLPKWSIFIMVAILLSLVGTGQAIAQESIPVKLSTPIGPAFTYQGQLKDGEGNPINDVNCDFKFTLWDEKVGGLQIGNPSALSAYIAGGFFTALVNGYNEFGPNAFNGQARWLQIEVQCPGDPSFVLLLPRQPLTSAPYASYAPLAGSVPWDGIGSMPAGFADGVDNDTLYSSGDGLNLLGNQFNVLFAGNGSATTASRSDHNHDHGALTGLADDDHPQYFALGQNETVTGIPAFTGGTSGANAPFSVDSNFQVTNLNADLLDGQHSGFFQNAANLNAGTLSTDRYSAYSDLAAEGYLDLSTGTDLLTRDQGDVRYSLTGHNHWGQTWNGNDFGLTLNSQAVYVNATALKGSARPNNGTGVQGFVGPEGSDAGMLVPTGVSGISSSPAGGWNDLTFGVFGKAAGTGAYGVYGEATITGTAGLATDDFGIGVYGEALKSGGTGVFGKGDTTGIKGSGYNGVYGISPTSNGNGVVGIANNGTSAYGVWGQSSTGYAGVFSGNVSVEGTLTKYSGSFKIDHPLDPANQYLYHSFVESPDMKNIYDGIVILDDKGEATVKLPDWFEALNSDFRYQLTCVGGYAPVYIAQEIMDNTFKIAGGESGLKVSWQVTGIRKDPWAEDHRIPVEEAKVASEVGTYLYPEGYGQPASSGVDYDRMQQLMATSTASTNLVSIFDPSKTYQTVTQP